MNSVALGEQVRESRLIRLVLGAIAIIAAAGFLTAALIWIPSYQVNRHLEQGRIQPEDVPEQVDRNRRTLAQILGGAAVLLGLYFTYRRIRSTERNVEIAQEGQITERFTRAIEQLGDERLAMRLGGIYALERIAWDSERDHWTVMEVLTAFVRENAPVWVQAEEVAPDVQAALAVIGRRNTAYDPERRVLNLSGVNIPGAHLTGTRFNLADFGESNLNGAYLIRAELNGAWLTYADLTGAHLIRAYLTYADLRGADLTGADLTDASYELEQLAEAESVEGIKGLSDEELAELERLRQASDEDDQQPREEGDSQ